MTKRNSTEKRRLPGLDGLRGLAALAVFGVHYNQIAGLYGSIGPVDIERLLAAGEHGVSVFFTLSGLLLSLPFWRAMRGSAQFPALRRYALARLARILPAYWLALTLLVALSGLWRFQAAWPDIAMHYLFVFNFAEFSIFSINAPFWTLAVEMQFYLLLPLLFFILRRRSCGQALVALSTFAIVAALANWGLINQLTAVVPWPADPRLSWIVPYGAVVTHSLLAHLPHFLIGVVAAGLFAPTFEHTAGDAARPSTAADVVFVLAALSVTVLIATPAADAITMPYGRYGLPLVPLLLCAMVVCAPLGRLTRALLDHRAMRGLGALSYAIYIWHLPVLTHADGLMREHGVDVAQHPLAFAVATLAITFALAICSWLLVERPVLRRLRAARQADH